MLIGYAMVSQGLRGGVLIEGYGMATMDDRDDVFQIPVLWSPDLYGDRCFYYDVFVSHSYDDESAELVDAPDPGDKMGLQSLPIPDLDVLIGYSEAVHQQTHLFLSTLAPQELDANSDPNQPERTVAGSLRHLITHKNNHHGQIDYIRGLQDQNWDLPPGGTGSVLTTGTS